MAREKRDTALRDEDAADRVASSYAYELEMEHGKAPQVPPIVL